MNLSEIQPAFNVVVAYDKAEQYRVKELNEKVPKVFEEILSAINQKALNRQKELALKETGLSALLPCNQQVILTELRRRGFNVNSTFDVQWESFQVTAFQAPHQRNGGRPTE